MSKTTKMVQIHVSPRGKGLLGWAIKVGRRRVSWFSSQANAEACAVFLARLMPSATVKFHKRDGTIRTEHTYPKSADPRKTKG